MTKYCLAYDSPDFLRDIIAKKLKLAGAINIEVYVESTLVFIDPKDFGLVHWKITIDQMTESLKYYLCAVAKNSENDFVEDTEFIDTAMNNYFQDEVVLKL